MDAKTPAGKHALASSVRVVEIVEQRLANLTRPLVVTGLLVGEAVRALARHAGRTALTAFLVTIGIAAVAWVVAIGEAGARRAQEQLQALGDNLV
jgi:hypothetical protein